MRDVYCSGCGSLAAKDVESENFPIRCPVCGRQFYPPSSISTTAFAAGRGITIETRRFFQNPQEAVGQFL